MFKRAAFVCLLLSVPLLMSAQTPQPPFGRDARVVIHNGNTYVRVSNVKLTLYCTDATHMIIAEDSDFNHVEWVYFKESIDWNLGSNGGKKTVYAKFRNEEKIVSMVVTDDILLDTSPPKKPMIKIDVPNKYFNDISLTVSLIIGAEDMEYFRVSNSLSFHAQKWRRFGHQNVEWQLAAGQDGERRVYAQFSDKAKNTSEIVNDYVIVDRTPL